VVTCEVKRHVEIKSFGDFGLQAQNLLDYSRQIESGRRVLTRYVKRTGKRSHFS
jgi:ribosomal protein L16/L10AE